jgi:hypothetical protein
MIRLKELEQQLALYRRDHGPCDNTLVGIKVYEEQDTQVLVLRQAGSTGWETAIEIGSLPCVDDTERHFIVSGRIPGADEDTWSHICVVGEEDPVDKFTLDILYEGDLPEDWKERNPTYEENDHLEWRFINATIEIPGPPIE